MKLIRYPHLVILCLLISYGMATAGAAEIVHTDAEVASSMVKKMTPLLENLTPDDVLEEGLVVTVAHTSGVSPAVVAAVGVELGKRDARQAVKGHWLHELDKQQTREQSVMYQPSPREALQPAHVVLALNQSRVDSDTYRIDAVLMSMTDIIGERGVRYRAGEVIPQSSIAVHWQTVDVKDPRISAKGTGFCNRKIDQSRWRYTAERAAELDARSNLMTRLQQAQVERVSEREGKVLSRESANLSVRGSLPPTQLLGVEFDAEQCRAEARVAVMARPEPVQEKQWWDSVKTVMSVFTLIL